MFEFGNAKKTMIIKKMPPPPIIIIIIKIIECLNLVMLKKQ